MQLQSGKNRHKHIVFCDFDGTITAVETFSGMLKQFAPELSAEIMPKLYKKELTLREGVRKILEAIPSRLYPEIMDYAEAKPIREGLPELIDFLDSQNIPFVIISGGLQDMVERVMRREKLLEKVAAITAVKIDTSSEYLRVDSAFEGGTELVAKVDVMSQYLAEETIAIGDSVTDINMALKADLVFARDRLIKYMEAEDKAYISWDNFFDILNYLRENLIK